MDGRYCLGLELADEGLDASVLTGFRERLVDNGAERVLFDRLLGLVKERGPLEAGGQRTGSTHVLARIGDLNRLELAGETVRAALEALAAAAPGWLAGVIDASWQRVCGQRIGIRPATSPASAAPATSAWTKPASSTSPPQPPST